MTIKNDIHEMLFTILLVVDGLNDIPQHTDHYSDRRFHATLDTWRVSCRYSMDAIDALIDKLHKAQNTAGKVKHPTKNLRSFTRVSEKGMLAARERAIHCRTGSLED